MIFPDTYNLYDKVERDRIQYTYCVDFKHISRYRALRQVIHQGNSDGRYIALETVNSFDTGTAMKRITVTAELENRLDLIAEKELGSATYAWIIAYVNRISDGFTALEGSELLVPNSVSSLFSNGEMLAPISAVKLNLGSE